MAFGDIGQSAMDALRPAQGAGGSNGTSGRVTGATPQQAVKVLSLRIPERAAQGSIAPLPLLTGQGSAAPGASAFTSLIAQLANSFKPQLPSGGAPQVPAPQAQAEAPILRGPFRGDFPMNPGGPAPSGGWEQNPTWNVPRDPENPRPPVIPGPSQPPTPGPAAPPPPPPPEPPRQTPPGNPLPPVITFPGPEVPSGPPIYDDPTPQRPEIPTYNPSPDVQGLFSEAPPAAWDYIPDYKRGLFDDYGW